MKQPNIKEWRTDALVSLLQDVAEEIEQGRGLNQIQIEIVKGIKYASKALNYAVNG